MLRSMASFINRNKERFATGSLAIFALLSLVIMVVLVGVGVCQMGMSIPGFVERHEAAAAGESPIGQALDGLECIFLAPLAFLLVRGIWDYVDHVVRPDESVGGRQPSQFLTEVKCLIIGLMIAVVATDLLKRALSRDGLSYEVAITGAILIGVLTGYVYVAGQEHRSVKVRQRID